MTTQNVLISAPDFGVMALTIVGTAPLVIERFSKKAELMAKMAEGKSSASKKVRAALFDVVLDVQPAYALADQISRPQVAANA